MNKPTHFYSTETWILTRMAFSQRHTIHVTVRLSVTFSLFDLELDPMTLILKFDTVMVKMYPQTKN